MISAGDFRNGITLEIDNAVYQIIEFQHVKPGKGAAFVRTKIKNVLSAPSVRRRNSRPHASTASRCSISMPMMTCSTS